jgi:hypothetical protein
MQSSDAEHQKDIAKLKGQVENLEAALKEREEMIKTKEGGT